MILSKLTRSRSKILVVSFVLTILVQGSTIFNQFCLTDDIAQHHVWLDAGENTGLRSDDPWLIASHAFQPYVLAAFFKCLHFIFPTLLIGKVIALFALWLTAFLIWEIGKACVGERAGWICLALFFVSDAWIGISGGFARTFAWPIVCLFLLASLKRQLIISCLALFFAAAIYPIVFVLLIPTFLFIALSDWQFQNASRSKLIPYNSYLIVPFLLLVCGVILILLKSYELNSHPLVGPQVQHSEIMTDPLFGQHGRWPLWPQPALVTILPWSFMAWGKVLLEPIMRYAEFFAIKSTVITIVVGVISVTIPVCALAKLFYFNRRAFIVFISLFFSAITVFFAAKLTLPKLYEPSRYLVWSIPVMSVILFSITAEMGVGQIKNISIRRTIYGLSVALILSRIPAIQGKGAEDISEYSKLYSAIRELPPNITIASYPRTSDFIPVVCHRNIYLSHESSHAVIFKNYREIMVSRQHRLISSLYSDDLGAIQKFCREEKIDWFIIEDRYYRKENVFTTHFQPFLDQINGLLENQPTFKLLSLAHQYGQEVQNGVYLLSANVVLASSS